MPNMNKNNKKYIIFYLAVFLLVAFLVLKYAGGMKGGKYDSFGEIYSDFQNEKVESFEIDENAKLTVKLKDENGVVGETKSYKLLSYSIFEFFLGDTIKEQIENGIITDFDYPEPSGGQTLMMFLPYLIMIGAVVIIWIVLIMRTGKSGKLNGFGRARTKTSVDEKKRVLFKDVAGADEEKEELKEIVDFLKEPSRYTKLGAKIPRGVLLIGPPGTGKTLLAKAVAGEAGVPFFSISGSDFVEMYVGVGASRVRDLFETAKKHPASIVFIDEIDAVGRHRGAGLGGGHDEREQTLNQLLVEMDGFGSGSAVIVIAATNRPDILDPALLRPGRFDRQVAVGYPDIKGRLEILKIHAQGKPFENSVSLEKIAKTTVGFTGADLANLLNEAALLAARRGKFLIGEKDLEDASIKIIVGTEKKSRVVKEKEKRLTAYHEAGHAVLTKLLQPDNQVHQISIIPTGRAGGYTIHRPNEDASYASKNEMKNEICVLLGGRVAEKLVLDDISTGASNDIQRATSIARSMVTRYGMSDILGPLVYDEHAGAEVFLGRDFNSQKLYSDKTAAVIDDEIKRIVCDAGDLAEKLLTENTSKLHFISEFLLSHEIMDEYQFEAAMSGAATTIEELVQISEESKKRSDAENKEKQRQDEINKKLRQEEERRKLNEMLGIYPPSTTGNTDNTKSSEADNDSNNNQQNQ